MTLLNKKSMKILLFSGFSICFCSFLYATSWRYMSQNLNRELLDFVHRFKINTKKHSKVNVLLFGYQRSSSTFVGHVIGCRDDTFYFYEPFWKIAKHSYFNGSKVCDLQNKCRDNNSSHYATRLLTSLYGCQQETLTHLLSEMQSQQPCERNRKLLRSSDVSQIQNVCVTSKVMVTKTLRITADAVNELLEIIDDIKVVYLFRDPRAIITSRSKFSSGKRNIKMCTKMFNDVKTMSIIAQKYPNNVIFLSSERMAKEPLGVTRKLFEFLGIEFTKSDIEQVTDLSDWQKKHERKKSEHNFNPYKNSGYDANMKWRLEIPWEVKLQIDTACMHVYQMLGYRNITSEAELRNVQILNIGIPNDSDSSFVVL